MIVSLCCGLNFYWVFQIDLLWYNMLSALPKWELLVIVGLACLASFWLIWPSSQLSICNCAVLSSSPLCCLIIDIIIIALYYAYTVLLVTWLMPVSLYITYLLPYFPYWFISSNFGTWLIFGIGGYIYCWHIFHGSIVNRCCSVLLFDEYEQLCGVYLWTTVEVQRILIWLFNICTWCYWLMWHIFGIWGAYLSLAH